MPPLLVAYALPSSIAAGDFDRNGTVDLQNTNGDIERLFRISDPSATINVDANGKFPVYIHGSATFDVRQVEVLREVLTWLLAEGQADHARDVDGAPVEHDRGVGGDVGPRAGPRAELRGGGRLRRRDCRGLRGSDGLRITVRDRVVSITQAGQ